MSKTRKELTGEREPTKPDWNYWRKRRWVGELRMN
jgi:hypothetical protein